MLTLKTKEKFREFLNSHKEYQEYKCRFEKLPLVCQQALVVEFFDSVGYFINVDIISYHLSLTLDQWFYVIKIDESDEDFITDEDYFSNRPEALSKAIEKADELFNLKTE